MNDYLKRIFNQIDENGNSLSLSERGVLDLALAGEKYKRTLGTIEIMEGGQCYYRKIVYVKNILRANSSWGLNYFVINNLPDGTIVELFCESTKYKLTKEQILAHGTFLWFKTHGFERQLFVPLEDWEKE